MRVVVVVPDELILTHGGASSAASEKVPVDAESFVGALVTNDYHMNWFFPDPAAIRILSIESVPEAPAD